MLFLRFRVYLLKVKLSKTAKKWEKFTVLIVEKGQPEVEIYSLKIIEELKVTIVLTSWKYKIAETSRNLFVLRFLSC